MSASQVLRKFLRSYDKILLLPMKQEKHLYEFAPFRIDPRERLLRRGADVIPLAPKAIETLLLLASSGGRVVEKEELIKRVWPDTFVEEGGPGEYDGGTLRP